VIDATPSVAPATTQVATDRSAGRIAGMFDAIAPRYDLLNHVLSAGIDRRWRARAIRALGLSGSEMLVDVCTGTADVALAARAGGAARVMGVDFSGAMLARGLDKVRRAGQASRIMLVRGDAMCLPLGEGVADAATVAFGIRNVERREVACAQLARVLRPGGRLAILEFGAPRVPGLRELYLWYFNTVLPRLGSLISGHGAAYSYLPASVGAFPAPEVFAKTLQEAGFVDVEAVPLSFGIVYLYVARRR
jgi:demethylmenaquinone methyltransferase / 2-methoxy-6-polyprenyl-1,4-benzoquinol methylase